MLVTLNLLLIYYESSRSFLSILHHFMQRRYMMLRSFPQHFVFYSIIDVSAPNGTFIRVADPLSDLHIDDISHKSQS